MSAKYSVDDRGNTVDFYDVTTFDLVARLDREAAVDGVPDHYTWDGDEAVTAWAAENGYAEALSEATQISNAATIDENKRLKAFVATRDAARLRVS